MDDDAAAAQSPTIPADIPASDPVHLVVMGVAGSGKTTVAALLAQRTGRPFAEADDFHPQANVDLMRAGVALTDEDRWPWLGSMRDWLDQQGAEGRSAVMTCSALKRSYRDLLRTAHGRVRFVHLTASPEVLAARVSGRTDHFMPASLLPSQLATLDPLADDEDGATLDAAATPEGLVEQILLDSAPATASRPAASGR
ncbi:gluconokinase [Oerskovia turbata]